jgi:hypothetical protein
MAKAKAIAGSLSTYASSWEGWTNPDSEYYVALMGYKIDIPGSAGTSLATNGYFGEPPGWASNSTSASYKYAQSEIKTFRCPIDESATTTKHAVKTSYKVGSLFTGGNIMNLTAEANRTLMVREIGKRHPVGQSGSDGHYIYADLHASLGYTGPALPGSWIRIWNQNSQGYITQAANAVALANVKYQDEFYTGAWDFDGNAVRNRVWGLLGTPSGGNDWWVPTTHGWYGWYDWGRPRMPHNWLFRVDSLFKPPASGNWQFQVYYNSCNFSMGSGVSNPIAGFDTAVSRSVYRIDWNPNYWNDSRCTLSYNGMDMNLYYPVSLYSSWCCWSGGYYVRARRLDASGNPDAMFGGASGIPLDPTNICRAP